MLSTFDLLVNSEYVVVCICLEYRLDKIHQGECRNMSVREQVLRLTEPCEALAFALSLLVGGCGEHAQH